MNRGLKGLSAWVLASPSACDAKLDPMNRGLKDALEAVDLDRRSRHDAKLDPMNRGLKVI